MRNATYVVAPLLFLACLLGGTASAGMHAQAAPTQTKDVTFQLDVAAFGTHAPYFMAQRKGYYQAEGLNVRFIPGRGSQSVVDTVARKGAEFGRAAVPNVILSVAKDVEVVSVATEVGKGPFGFFVPRSSGITSIKQLEGKSVIVPPGTPQAIILPAILRANGVDASRVRILNVDLSAHINVYASGQGDAVATSVDFGAPVINTSRPSLFISWADNKLSIPGHSIITHPDILRNDPDLVRRFLRATYKGMKAAEGDPGLASQLIVDANPVTNLNIAKGQAQWAARYRCPVRVAKNWPRGRHSIADWRRAILYLERHGGLATGSTPTDYLTQMFFPLATKVSANTVPQQLCNPAKKKN